MCLCSLQLEEERCPPPHCKNKKLRFRKFMGQEAKFVQGHHEQLPAQGVWAHCVYWLLEHVVRAITAPALFLSVTEGAVVEQMLINAQLSKKWSQENSFLHCFPLRAHSLDSACQPIICEGSRTPVRPREETVYRGNHLTINVRVIMLYTLSLYSAGCQS